MNMGPKKKQKEKLSESPSDFGRRLADEAEARRQNAFRTAEARRQGQIPLQKLTSRPKPSVLKKVGRVLRNIRRKA